MLMRLLIILYVRRWCVLLFLFLRWLLLLIKSLLVIKYCLRQGFPRDILFSSILSAILWYFIIFLRLFQPSIKEWIIYTLRNLFLGLYNLSTARINLGYEIIKFERFWLSFCHLFFDILHLLALVDGLIVQSFEDVWLTIAFLLFGALMNGRVEGALGYFLI